MTSNLLVRDTTDTHEAVTFSHRVTASGSFVFVNAYRRTANDSDVFRKTYRTTDVTETKQALIERFVSAGFIAR